MRNTSRVGRKKILCRSVCVNTIPLVKIVVHCDSYAVFLYLIRLQIIIVITFVNFYGDVSGFKYSPVRCVDLRVETLWWSWFLINISLSLLQVFLKTWSLVFFFLVGTFVTHFSAFVHLYYVSSPPLGRSWSQ